jgi:hypothetical protein
VGKWPAEATVQSLAKGGPLIHGDTAAEICQKGQSSELMTAASNYRAAAGRWGNTVRRRRD